ncbi:hypothetical protein OJ962_14240, partial [Solirubrobacter sp. CPCC 204708]
MPHGRPLGLCGRDELARERPGRFRRVGVQQHRRVADAGGRERPRPLGEQRDRLLGRPDQVGGRGTGPFAGRRGEHGALAERRAAQRRRDRVDAAAQLALRRQVVAGHHREQRLQLEPRFAQLRVVADLVDHRQRGAHGFGGAAAVEVRDRELQRDLGARRGLAGGVQRGPQMLGGALVERGQLRVPELAQQRGPDLRIGRFLERAAQQRRGVCGHALREARSCYDQLAGRVGVALADSLVARGALVA